MKIVISCMQIRKKPNHYAYISKSMVIAKKKTIVSTDIKYQKLNTSLTSSSSSSREVSHVLTKKEDSVTKEAAAALFNSTHMSF